jgi:hypothetical protein
MERGSGDRPEVTAGARSSKGSSDETDMKNPRGGYHTPAHPTRSHTRRGARGTAQRSPPEPEAL